MDEETDYRIDMLKVRYDKMDEAAHNQEQLNLQERITAVIDKIAPMLDKDELSLICWATGTQRKESNANHR